jgi:hypothetical protein
MTADPNGRRQECRLLSRQGKADKGRALANFRLSARRTLAKMPTSVKWPEAVLGQKGVRPTDDAWREMKREAYGFMVQHMSVLRQNLDVTELMTRIEAGGPKMALTLTTLGIEVPSRQFQDRSGPKPMPFGKVFFLEVASPWSGVLDLRDAEVIKIVESYRKKK